MRTLTVAAPMPLAASLYSGDGRTWYPARPAWLGPVTPGDVVWFAHPEIPTGVPFRWATLAEADVSGLDLESYSTRALLLYHSVLRPDSSWPITPEMLKVATLAQADRFGCRLEQVVTAYTHDGARRPAECGRRIAWCEQLARTMVVSR